VTSAPQQASAGQHSGIGCVARFFWMAAGNAILAFLLIFIAQQQGATLSWRDAAYWGIVASLLGVRMVDIRWLDGRTTEGEPATMALWRRWAMLLAAISLVLWVLAHLVASLGWLT
jgi:hypothetical protein